MLTSVKTELVGCFYAKDHLQIFTVDNHSLVRQWDLISGDCIKSYPLQIAQSSTSTEAKNPFKHSAIIQACKVDSESRYLLVAFEGGVVQIHNLYSGEILFNKLLEDSLKLEHEASNIMFLGVRSPFWFMVTCWEGYVNFYSKP